MNKEELHEVLLECYHALYELKNLVTDAEEDLKYRKLMFRINEQLNNIEEAL